MTTHPFFDYERPMALARQGGGGEETENSTAAFINARRLGYRYLDIDLQVNADGVLVAHHDHSLERPTKLTGTVYERTWDELLEARLPNGEPLARFDELIEAHPVAFWNIEVKSEEATKPVVNMVHRRGIDQRVCLNSFSDMRMRKIRKAAAGLTPAYSTQYSTSTVHVDSTWFSHAIFIS
jgi:glycerophosphoryl diester phosphodiesterase